MIDFPLPPAPHIARTKQPAAAPAVESDVIRALVMQGICAMFERSWR